MAAGAVSGNGRYADVEYKGRRFTLSQWDNDAMDAVSSAAFRKAKRVADDPQERASLSRMFSLGEFSFEAVVNAGGLDRDRELLATFLYHLLKKDQPDITLGVCDEMVRDQREAVLVAVSEANPQIRQTMAPGAPAGQPQARQNDPSPPSESPAKPSA